MASFLYRTSGMAAAFHQALEPPQWAAFFYLTAWETFFLVPRGDRGRDAVAECAVGLGFQRLLQSGRASPATCGAEASPSDLPVCAHYYGLWREARSSLAGGGNVTVATTTKDVVQGLLAEELGQLYRSYHGTGPAASPVPPSTFALPTDDNVPLAMFRLWCAKLWLECVDVEAPVATLDTFQVVSSFLRDLVSGPPIIRPGWRAANTPATGQLCLVALQEFLCLVHGCSDVADMLVPAVPSGASASWLAQAQQVIANTNRAFGAGAAHVATAAGGWTPSLLLGQHESATAGASAPERGVAELLEQLYYVTRVHIALLVPLWAPTREPCTRKVALAAAQLLVAFVGGLVMEEPPAVPCDVAPRWMRAWSLVGHAALRAVCHGIASEILECSALGAEPPGVKGAGCVAEAANVHAHAASGSDPEVPRDALLARLHAIEAQRLLTRCRADHLFVPPGLISLSKSERRGGPRWYTASYAAILLSSIVDGVIGLSTVAQQDVEVLLQQTHHAEESTTPETRMAPLHRVLLQLLAPWDAGPTGGGDGPLRCMYVVALLNGERAPVAATPQARPQQRLRADQVLLVGQHLSQAVVEHVNALLFSVVAPPAGPAAADSERPPPVAATASTSGAARVVDTCLRHIAASSPGRFQRCVGRLQLYTGWEVDGAAAATSVQALFRECLGVGAEQVTDDVFFQRGQARAVVLLACTPSGPWRWATVAEPCLRTAAQADAFLFEFFPALLQQIGFEWPWSETLKRLRMLQSERGRVSRTPLLHCVGEELGVAPAVELRDFAACLDDVPSVPLLVGLIHGSASMAVGRHEWQLRELWAHALAAMDGQTDTDGENMLLQRLVAGLLTGRTYWSRLEGVFPESLHQYILSDLAPLLLPQRPGGSGVSGVEGTAACLLPTYYAPAGSSALELLLTTPFVFAVQHSAGAWREDGVHVIDEVERLLRSGVRTTEMILKLKTSHRLSGDDKERLVARYTAETLLAVVLCAAVAIPCRLSAEGDLDEPVTTRRNASEAAPATRWKMDWLNPCTGFVSKLQWLLRCCAPLFETLLTDVELCVAASGDGRVVEAGGAATASSGSDSDEVAQNHPLRRRGTSASSATVMAEVAGAVGMGLRGPLALSMVSSHAEDGGSPRRSACRFKLSRAADDLCGRCGYQFYPLEWAVGVAHVAQQRGHDTASGVDAPAAPRQCPYSMFAAVAYQFGLHWGGGDARAAAGAGADAELRPAVRSLRAALRTYRFAQAMLACMLDTPEPGVAGPSAAPQGMRSGGATMEPRGGASSGVMTLWAVARAQHASKAGAAAATASAPQSDAAPPGYHAVVRPADVLVVVCQCFLPQYTEDGSASGRDDEVDGTDDGDGGEYGDNESFHQPRKRRQRVVDDAGSRGSRVASMERQMERLAAWALERQQRWQRGSRGGLWHEAAPSVLAAVERHLKAPREGGDDGIVAMVLGALPPRTPPRDGVAALAAAVMASAEAAPPGPDTAVAQVLHAHLLYALAHGWADDSPTAANSLTFDTEPLARLVIRQWGCRIMEHLRRWEAHGTAAMEAGAESGAGLVASLGAALRSADRLDPLSRHDVELALELLTALKGAPLGGVAASWGPTHTGAVLYRPAYLTPAQDALSELLRGVRTAGSVPVASAWSLMFHSPAMAREW